MFFLTIYVLLWNDMPQINHILASWDSKSKTWIERFWNMREIIILMIWYYVGEWDRFPLPKWRGGQYCNVFHVIPTCKIRSLKLLDIGVMNICYIVCRKRIGVEHAAIKVKCLVLFSSFINYWFVYRRIPTYLPNFFFVGPHCDSRHIYQRHERNGSLHRLVVLSYPLSC